MPRGHGDIKQFVGGSLKQSVEVEPSQVCHEWSLSTTTYSSLTMICG